MLNKPCVGFQVISDIDNAAGPVFNSGILEILLSSLSLGDPEFWC